MPFDPTKPANGSPKSSLEMREQFNALKALIDAQAAQILALTGQITTLNDSIEAFSARITPIGGVVPWHKDMPGMLPLTGCFVECNGQVLNDPESPLNGQTIPNYNGDGRFLRAGMNSGQTGGIDSFGTATAEAFGSGTPVTVVSPDFSPGATPIPPYETYVLVMRIK